MILKSLINTEIHADACLQTNARQKKNTSELIDLHKIRSKKHKYSYA